MTIIARTIAHKQPVLHRLLMWLTFSFIYTASHAAETRREIQEPGLWLEKSGQFEAAELMEMEISITVTGMLSRTRITQRFRNPGNEWLQGNYLFPLPDDASVDEMQMHIGEHTINGVIQSRAQARATFKNARHEGKQTSLIEYQRPNLYQSSVANIPPRSEITVSIGYQSRVRYSDGAFSLRLPMTLTPRYIPLPRLAHSNGASEMLLPTSSSGWAHATLELDKGTEISPPLTDSTNAVRARFSIDIDAGVELEQIDSASHEIEKSVDGTRWRLTLAQNTIPTDQDFELEWIPKIGQSPLAALFSQQRETSAAKTETFASLMLIPPQDLFDQHRPPREVIFVIDTSGSMDGQPIAQARTALTLAIQRLRASDQFNVIEFNDKASALFSTAVAADSNTIRKATNRVRNLYAGGGTEIGAALQLSLQSPKSDERVRQIIFITDGSVGNEAAIFEDIRAHLGSSRLFTIGIGSAPNTWFMRKAAELGRGSYTILSREQAIGEKMVSLFRKLESPVLTDLELQWLGVNAPEIYPRTVPDLYIGEPVLADARWSQELRNGELLLSGNHNGRSWERRLKLSGGIDHKPTSETAMGLDKLWASRKIETLNDRLIYDADPDALKSKIAKLALDYGLVTRFTSLVAVADAKPRDAANDALKIVDIPASKPAGTNLDYPQGALGVKYQFLLSAVFFSLSTLFGLATLAQVRQL